MRRKLLALLAVLTLGGSAACLEPPDAPVQDDDTGDDDVTGDDDTGDDDTGPPQDADHDGWTSEDDCDDGNANVYPGAPDVCDGVADNDCDGVDDPQEADADGDGLGACGGDCDDGDPAVHPGAEEVCDGHDQDCDGTADDGLPLLEWFADGDGDGFGDPGAPTSRCAAPPDHVADGSDCDDGDPGVHPGAEEVCGNHRDDDCDGGSGTCAPSGVRDLSEADAILVGEDEYDRFASSAARAGDVDGDGYADLLIGAYEADGVGTWSGKVYVVRGPVEGTVLLGGGVAASVGAVYSGGAAYDYAGASVAAGDLYDTGDIGLILGASGHDGGGTAAGAVIVVPEPTTAGTHALPAGGHALTGEVASTSVGTAVAAVGDVDGDGYGDLLVGSPYNDGGGTNAGKAYLVLGPVEASASLATAHASFRGERSGDSAGWSVAAAGDVDCDGYADLLIGAPDSDGAGTGSGAAYLVRGPVEAGERVLSDADAVLTGEGPDDSAGYAVAGVGDIDGDGCDDVAVGAPFATHGGLMVGKVYVLFRPPDGPHGLSIADVQYAGEAEGDFAGSAVAGAGDVDGDGSLDLVVGASGSGDGGYGAGKAYWVPGPITPGAYSLGTVPAFLGEAASDGAGSVVAGPGDVNGDGYDDILVGADGNDRAGSAAGAAYVILGGGA
ncbi:hypothetical protein L6R50_20190 [Myxococcota bacterium]|nr:hypothetical protein [Myxococcota bacterium]